MYFHEIEAAYKRMFLIVWVVAVCLFQGACSAPRYMTGTELRRDSDHFIGWSQNGTKLFILRRVIYELPNSPGIGLLDEIIRPHEDLYHITREECFIDELNPASRQLTTLYSAPCLLPEPERHAVVSPDNKKLAYTTPTALIVRNLMTGQVLLTEQVVVERIGWSPDSKRIVYYSAGKIFTAETGESSLLEPFREVGLNGKEAAWLTALQQATLEWKTNNSHDGDILIKDSNSGHLLKEVVANHWRLPNKKSGIELCGRSSLSPQHSRIISTRNYCYASGDARYIVARSFWGAYGWLVIDTETDEGFYVYDRRKWRKRRGTRLGI